MTLIYIYEYLIHVRMAGISLIYIASGYDDVLDVLMRGHCGLLGRWYGLGRRDRIHITLRCNQRNIINLSKIAVIDFHVMY